MSQQDNPSPSPATTSTPNLRVCFLWHQHQPDYRSGDHFVLPWVWLHATKDYLEMAQHIERAPGMRATFNLVPVMLSQLEEYLGDQVTDPVLTCMRKQASQLTAKEKQLMIEQFFFANETRFIRRSPRYSELLDRSRGLPRENGIDTSSFSEQDFRDLAMHYALAWTGEISRRTQPILSLIEKDRDFTEEERNTLMDAHRAIVREIVPLHKKLAESGQIELTTSAYYHPILPLLIDSDCATESMRGASLPKDNFAYPDDADVQIEQGKAYATKAFGSTPAGLWPSEGSVSEAALDRIAHAGFTWAATDEDILYRSIAKSGLTQDYRNLSKFFSWKYQSPSGPLTLFFRDHGLSDKIGFEYQTWRAEDAVGDVMSALQSIRDGLIGALGAESLEEASVSIILDGENCWESYPNNGFDFLSQLYHALTNTQGIQPALFGEVAKSKSQSHVLTQIYAGSWINSDFGIWIGRSEENAAWGALITARKAFASMRERVSGMSDGAARIARAYEELLIAEGSDWFWWYDDQNFGIETEKFDELFRMHLRAVYVHLDAPVPETLNVPIKLQAGITPARVRKVPTGRISPAVFGTEEGLDWDNAIPMQVWSTGAMHRASATALTTVQVGWNDDEFFVRVLPDEDEVTRVIIEFTTPNGVTVYLHEASFGIRRADEVTPIPVSGRGILKDAAEIAIPRWLLEGEDTIRFAVTVEHGPKRVARYPHADWFECRIQ
jgi:alpha-amylase/alpha-mannosidase (GH57 family)